MRRTGRSPGPAAIAGPAWDAPSSYWMLASTGDALFYTLDRHLYRTDGTPSGAVRIEHQGFVSSFTAVGGSLAFDSASIDYPSTVSVIAPGSTQPTELARNAAVLEAIDHRLYFIDPGGLASWAPGEGARTISADVPVPISYGGTPDVAKVGDALFWNGPGDQLYTFAGGSARLVSTHARQANAFTALPDGRVLFVAQDDRGGLPFRASVWVTDGTEPGTRRLTEPSNAYGPVREVAATRGGAVFADWAWHDGLELYRSDGTVEGTGQLKDTNALTIGSDPYGAARTGDRVTFSTAEHGALWSTDGTAAGTAPILDAQISPGSFFGIGRLGRSYIFSAGSGGPGENQELWRSDGTAAGTVRLQTDGLGHSPAIAANDRTMLLANTNGLFRTDGLSASRVLTGSDYSRGVDVDDGFLVGAYDGIEHGVELLHLDEDGTNPRLVGDLVPGELGSYPGAFGRAGDMVPVVEGDTIYLTNRVGDEGLLYRTDGTQTGTVLLHRFPLGADDPPFDFTRFAGTTWFTATDRDTGRELWRTDGTPAGTRLARDTAPGRLSSDPLDLVATDDFLFFTAVDPFTGPEPWRIRRTAAVEDPPVTVAPLLPSEPPLPALVPELPGVGVVDRRPPPPTARVSLSVRRLRTIHRGRTRWRVSGRVSGVSGCAGGRVRVVLGRGARPLKQTTARLRGCRYDAVISTTSRSSGRWLQVRTVTSLELPAATSPRRMLGTRPGRPIIRFG